MGWGQGVSSDGAAESRAVCWGVVRDQIVTFGWHDGVVKNSERGFSACAERLVSVRDTCAELGQVENCEGRLMDWAIDYLYGDGSAKVCHTTCTTMSKIREQRERAYGN